MKIEKFIKSKILFVASLLLLIATSVHLVWWLITAFQNNMAIDYLQYLITVICAGITCTLLFLSLKKSKIIVKGYVICIIMELLNLIIAILGILNYI